MALRPLRIDGRPPGSMQLMVRQNNFNFNNGNVFPDISNATQLNGNVSKIDLSVTAAKAAVTPPAYRVFPVNKRF